MSQPHRGRGARLALPAALLESSGVVISGEISRVAILITHMKGLKTPLMIASHEPNKSPDTNHRTTALRHMAQKPENSRALCVQGCRALLRIGLNGA